MRCSFVGCAVLFLLGCTVLPAGEEGDTKPNEGVLPSSFRGLPLLWIPKRDAPEELKGDLSAPVWKKAARVPLVDCISGKKAKHKTDAYLFCSDDALFVGFRCVEPDVENLKSDGRVPWQNDEVELFFEPDKDTLQKPYHQICLDVAQKTYFGRVHIYPLFGHAQVRDKKSWRPDIETSVETGEGVWSCAVKIPFEEMRLTEAAKKKNTLWRLNLYRHRPKRGEEKSLEFGWSPPGTGFFHSAGKFGYALPEVFASEELIKRVRAEAAAWRPADTGEVEPIVRYEAIKRIGELAAESYGERARAEERLKAIAEFAPVNLKEVKAQLEHAMAACPDESVVLSARRLMGDIKQMEALKNDPDPPPDHIRRRGRGAVIRR